MYAPQEVGKVSQNLSLRRSPERKYPPNQKVYLNQQNYPLHLLENAQNYIVVVLQYVAIAVVVIVAVVIHVVA